MLVDKTMATYRIASCTEWLAPTPWGSTPLCPSFSGQTRCLLFPWASLLIIHVITVLLSSWPDSARPSSQRSDRTELGLCTSLVESTHTGTQARKCVSCDLELTATADALSAHESHSEKLMKEERYNKNYYLLNKFSLMILWKMDVQFFRVTKKTGQLGKNLLAARLVVTVIIVNYNFKWKKLNFIAPNFPKQQIENPTISVSKFF